MSGAPILGEIYMFPQLSVEKVWKRSKKWSGSVPLVISLNNSMMQEWIDLPSTSGSKSVPTWNVNTAIFLQSFTVSSHVLHAKHMHEWWDFCPMEGAFPQKWSHSGQSERVPADSAACSWTSFMREECIQNNQTCVKARLLRSWQRADGLAPFTPAVNALAWCRRRSHQAVAQLKNVQQKLKKKPSTSGKLPHPEGAVWSKTYFLF